MVMGGTSGCDINIGQVARHGDQICDDSSDSDRVIERLPQDSLFVGLDKFGRGRRREKRWKMRSRLRRLMKRRLDFELRSETDC
jgi:hypothetical protein